MTDAAQSQSQSWTADPDAQGDGRQERLQSFKEKGNVMNNNHPIVRHPRKTHRFARPAAWLLMAIVAFAAMPAFAQVTSSAMREDPACTASVTIFEAKQTSVNIRIGFKWTTFGATAATAVIRLFPQGSSVPIYTSGGISVSPVASGNLYFLITPPGPYPSGTYKARVTLTANCGASSQSEAFFPYSGGSVVLQPIVRCDTQATGNGQVWGQQCLSFIPNGAGGYTLNNTAITDGDPSGQNLQHPFLGVGCQTFRNGTMIEQYEVEHVLGSQQGNIVEYGFSNGGFYQTGTTPQGNYFTLPTTVPANGATYSRTCQHWAGFNLVQTTVTATVQ
ncbi:MAG: hypothetical protein HOP03_14395 [Lysobacter sp.]|nr:hypothetical protein [Lysobacter sp.]